MSRNDVVKVLLEESEIPRQWYNIVADMPNKPAPYYSPFTGEVMKPEEMKAIFPDALIAQEMSADRYIEIPDEVRDMYRQWRPTPLFRARSLEKTIPENCIAVEDSPNGIRSAHGAGMKTVMVPDLIEPDEELVKLLYRKFAEIDATNNDCSR